MGRGSMHGPLGIVGLITALIATGAVAQELVVSSLDKAACYTDDVDFGVYSEAPGTTSIRGAINAEPGDECLLRFIPSHDSSRDEFAAEIMIDGRLVQLFRAKIQRTDKQVDKGYPSIGT